MPDLEDLTHIVITRINERGASERNLNLRIYPGSIVARETRLEVRKVARQTLGRLKLGDMTPEEIDKVLTALEISGQN